MPGIFTDFKQKISLLNAIAWLLDLVDDPQFSSQHYKIHISERTSLHRRKYPASRYTGPWTFTLTGKPSVYDHGSD